MCAFETRDHYERTSQRIEQQFDFAVASIARGAYYVYIHDGEDERWTKMKLYVVVAAHGKFDFEI